jgi:hypothetical protein
VEEEEEVGEEQEEEAEELDDDDDDDGDKCALCGGGVPFPDNQIVFCEGPCLKAYHQQCLSPVRSHC